MRPTSEPIRLHPIAALVAAIVVFTPAIAELEPDRELRIALAPRIRTLEATATLRLSDLRANEPAVDLNPALEIVGVRIDGSPARFDVSDAEGIRRVTFLHDNELRGAHRFTVSYAGKLPESIGPDGARLPAAARWYPELVGFDGRATWRVTAELPEGWDAVVEGRRVSREETRGKVLVTHESELPLFGVHLAAGRWVHVERRHGDVGVAALLKEGDRDRAEALIASAIRYLDRHAERFGPFAWPRLTVAESPDGRGAGLPGIVLLGRNEMMPPAVREVALARYVARSWWGGAVHVDASGGDWSEGLAAYVADHEAKRLAGPEAAQEYRRDIARSYTTVATSGGDVSLGRIRRETPLPAAAIARDKGLMVFHMLERRLGPSAFRDALRRFYRTNRHRRASWGAVRAAFSAEAGEDLGWFFDQWVGRPGAPVLELADVSFDDLEITGTLVQQGGPWRLRVPLVVEGPGGTEHRSFEFDSERGRFRIPVSSRPRRLVVDPEFDVFRKLGQRELPPTLTSALADPVTLLVVEDRGDKSEAAAYRELAETLAGSEGRRVVSASQLSADRLTIGSVLLLGLPLGDPTEALVDALPAEVSIGIDGFGVGGGRFRDPRSALLAVGRHPDDPRRAVALFWGLSPRAIRLAGANLLKNSDFSWAAFIDGTAGTRGVASGPEASLVHVFSGNPPGGDAVQQP
jgi:hypothetical protein